MQSHTSATKITEESGILLPQRKAPDKIPPLVVVCDFETTVYEGQTSTEVWAAACVPLHSEEVLIFHSIGDWFDHISRQKRNVVCYFHNLKFDGEFILSYLMNNPLFSLAYDYGYIGIVDGDFRERRDMQSMTFRYSISDRGQWYGITIKVGKFYIDIRDSLKLLPMSVERIGEGFKTKHRKLSMEYTGRRYAGCEITDEEKKYIRNDVLVVKEAMEVMYAEGHRKTTIGSCCLAEFKHLSYLDDKKQWEKQYPNLYEYELDEKEFGATSAGAYIRLSYRGGWCYLVKGRENRMAYNGVTADVNSLYPSMMHSESGNRYPVGKPHFWKGDIPYDALHYDRYYFVRIRTEFRLKPGKLPCIQLKSNPLYDPTEWLETSDVKSLVDGRYSCFIEDAITGDVRRTWVEMVLTMTDYQLIQEHYDLIGLEIMDGCWFETKKGIFDDYIDKYKALKIKSKGARREIAKLFLNNLYGKMAMNTDSSFKYAELDPDGALRFLEVPQYKKAPGYIPIGSAITSYARNFTIRAAQKNYYGKNRPGFIYADTDSIHCDLRPEELKGIKADPAAFCCWKLEASWDHALFVRQKTYLEHIVAENLEPIENPYYSVKCAGMPKPCKDLFILATNPETRRRMMEDNDFFVEVVDKYGETGAAFLIREQLKLTDFKIGLVIPTGKLMPKHIPGGILLVDSPYCMRKKLIYS